MGLAFFYCDGNSIERQSTFNIFSSILKQLVTLVAARADCPRLETLLRLYKQEPIPSIEFVETQLHQICLFFNDVYIIVDGLDECATRDTIQNVLLRLAGSAKVLVTSRPETDLVSAFAGKPCLNMDEAAKADIKKHVQWQIQNNPGLRNIRPSLKQKIEKDLVGKSAGMYCHPKISL